MNVEKFIIKRGILKLTWIIFLAISATLGEPESPL